MTSQKANDRLEGPGACQPSAYRGFENRNLLLEDFAEVSKGSVGDVCSKNSPPLSEGHAKKMASDLNNEDTGVSAEIEIVQSSTDVEDAFPSSGTSDCGSVIMEMADLLSHSSSNLSATTPITDPVQQSRRVDESTGALTDQQEKTEIKLEPSPSPLRPDEPASTPSSLGSARTTVSEMSDEQEETEIDGKDTALYENLDGPQSAMDVADLDRENERDSLDCCESIHTSDLSPLCSARESTSDTEDQDVRLSDHSTDPLLVDQSSPLDAQQTPDSNSSGDRTILKGTEDPLDSDSSLTDLPKISDESTEEDNSSSAFSVVSESEIEICSDRITDNALTAPENPTNVERENPMPCDNSKNSVPRGVATFPSHRHTEGASDRPTKLSQSTSHSSQSTRRRT